MIEVVSATAIVAASAFAQLAIRPFSSRALNRLEGAGLVVAFTVQLSSIMFWFMEDGSTASVIFTAFLVSLVAIFLAACLGVALFFARRQRAASQALLSTLRRASIAKLHGLTPGPQGSGLVAKLRRSAKRARQSRCCCCTRPRTPTGTAETQEDIMGPTSSEQPTCRGDGAARLAAGPCVELTDHSVRLHVNPLIRDSDTRTATGQTVPLSVARQSFQQRTQAAREKEARADKQHGASAQAKPAQPRSASASDHARPDRRQRAMLAARQGSWARYTHRRGGNGARVPRRSKSGGGRGRSAASGQTRAVQVGGPPASGVALGAPVTAPPATRMATATPPPATH